jgi:hypothetical protein
MPAPALKIPVQVDLESLKKQMDSGANHVGQAAKAMGQQFQKLNGTIVAAGGSAAAAYATGFAGAALRIAGSLGLVIGVVKLIGSVIDTTREQLEKMVAVADKSKSATVTPRFFQAFTAEADKLQVKTEDLESALTSAFNATKDQAPIDTDAWSVGEEKITAVEKALRVYNETLAKSAGQTLNGLVLFRDADTQEKKIQAVLQAMVQLEQIGQRTAALDIGEKMFGAQFVDRIRQGRTSAAEMLDTIQKSSEASSGVFSNDTIRRAKEIDDQLKRAHQTLDKNLKPTWDSLADKMLTIKSLWGDVVELVAKAAALSQKVGILPTAADSALNQKLAELQKLEADFAQSSRFSGTVVADRRNAALLQRITALKEEIRSLQEDARDDAISAAAKAGPSKGIGDVPKPPPKPEEDKERLDSFERAILLAEKNTSVTEAETAAIDLNAGARARAKLVAELQAAAIKANTEAGEEDTKVTAEQAEAINRVADAAERAAQRLNDARSPLRNFAREAADMNTQLQNAAVSGLRGFEDALIDIGKGTTTVADAFKKMAASILEDLARIAIRQSITGPLSTLFSSGFAPTPLAWGGPTAAGSPYLVGERGPELFVPKTAGDIIPNNIVKNGMGATHISLATTIDARGSDIGEGRLRQLLAEHEVRIKSDIVPIVRQAQSRRTL